MPKLTAKRYQERQTKRSSVKSYIDPSIIVQPTVADIRERNGLPRVPIAREPLAERGKTMPKLTSKTYGAGRGRQAQETVLTDGFTEWLTDDDNLQSVLNGTYVTLEEADFEGPKSKVGEALIAHLELDPTEYHAPTGPPTVEGGVIDVTVRPMTEARKIREGIIPDPNADAEAS